MWFDQLNFRTKLMINFFICSGSLLIALLFCTIQLESINSTLNYLKTTSISSLKSGSLISQLRLRYRIRSLEYILEEDKSKQEKLENSLAELDAQLISELKQQQASSESTERTLIDAVTLNVAAYKEAVRNAINLQKQGNIQGALKIQKTVWVERANKLRDSTDALEKYYRDNAIQHVENASQKGNTAKWMAYISLLVAAIVAIGFSWWFGTNIFRRLASVAQVTRQVAEGDLRTDVPAAASDEIGQLVEAMRRMRDALKKSVVNTKTHSEQLVKVADQLNNNVAQMVSSSAIQSNSASAIAANIEELTVSINHVSDNTTDTSSLAKDADKKAIEGVNTIENVVKEISTLTDVINSTATRISTLEEETTQISKITTVIKDIAGQTNLLALNAAIEAARAGEQGKGFAVVADEVRKLSERTSQSTAEIAQMIGSIQSSAHEAVDRVQAGVQAVENGMTLAESAGAAINEIRDKARNVATLLSDIASGLQEQSIASVDAAKKNRKHCFACKSNAWRGGKYL